MSTLFKLLNPSHKDLPLSLRKWLALGTAVTLFATTPLDAENTYWDQYGQQPVLIEQVTGSRTQTLKLTNFENGMLIAELDGGVGEIALPFTESMVSNLRISNDGMRRVTELVRQENYTGALTLLRPIAYPLIKFHQVPEAFQQLHSPIQTLFQTLMSAGLLDEAYDLINRIELEKSAPSYSQMGIQMIGALIEEKSFDNAAALANKIPVNGAYTANIRPVLDVADALRGAEQFEAVVPLYKAMRSSVSGEARANVDMWLAYSLVLAERLDEASPIIDSLEEPAPENRLFSLYKLLQGSREYRQGNFRDALDLLTRGFVRAQTSYVWVPETLFLIGDCYLRAEDTDAAYSAWTELAILYPTTPWGQRASKQLEDLPKPKTLPF